MKKYLIIAATVFAVFMMTSSTHAGTPSISPTSSTVWNNFDTVTQGFGGMGSQWSLIFNPDGTFYEKCNYDAGDGSNHISYTVNDCGGQWIDLSGNTIAHYPGQTGSFTYASIAKNGFIPAWNATDSANCGTLSSCEAYVTSTGNLSASVITNVPFSWNGTSIFPTQLHQYKSDATTTIQEGSSTTETTAVFSALLNSTVSTDTLQLQVEVEPSSTAFMNVQNVTSSAAVSPGQVATATYYGIVPRESGSNGQFHWQARVINGNGVTSTWITYASVVGTPQVPIRSESSEITSPPTVSSTVTSMPGSLPPDAPQTDFVIGAVPLYTQSTSSYPSATTTASWATAPYDDALPGTGCGQSTSTIGVCGCSISSAVMVLRYFGVTSSTSSTDVNPLNLNNWLASRA